MASRKWCDLNLFDFQFQTDRLYLSNLCGNRETLVEKVEAIELKLNDKFGVFEKLNNYFERSPFDIRLMRIDKDFFLDISIRSAEKYFKRECYTFVHFNMSHPLTRLLRLNIPEIEHEQNQKGFYHRQVPVTWNSLYRACYGEQSDFAVIYSSFRQTADCKDQCFNVMPHTFVNIALDSVDLCSFHYK